MKPLILFFNGVSNDGLIQLLSWENGKISYQYHGSTRLFSHIDHEFFDKSMILLDIRDQVGLSIPKQTKIFFNEITEPDTHQKNLQKVEQIIQHFPHISCLNHPKYILQTTRDKIYEKLQGIPNLIVPKAFRFAPLSPMDIVQAIENQQFEYPVIIRETGTHGASNVYLLHSKDEVYSNYALPLDGREFYLIQFYDYQEKGVFHKIRLIVVDGQYYFRNRDVKDHWMVEDGKCEAFMHKNEIYLNEEQALIQDFDTQFKPLIQPLISEIHKRLPLDYFGIDCNINSSGKVLLFEANASMNNFFKDAKTNTAHRLEKSIRKIEKAIIDMLLHRLDN